MSKARTRTAYRHRYHHSCVVEALQIGPSSEQCDRLKTTSYGIS